MRTLAEGFNYFTVCLENLFNDCVCFVIDIVNVETDVLDVEIPSNPGAMLTREPAATVVASVFSIGICEVAGELG